jgi:hypothetical protein
MHRIIGLTGLRGSGKDTVAGLLGSAGYKRIAFADALYEEVSEAFGVPIEVLQNRATKETPLFALALSRCKDKVFVANRFAYPDRATDRAPFEQFMAGLAEDEVRLRLPRSPREILQYWGTEYRRLGISDDYWREIIARRINDFPHERLVITDVRFPDEAKLVSSAGGVVLRTVRPGLPPRDLAHEHVSERAMLDYPVDGEIVNLENDLAGTKRNALAAIVEISAEARLGDTHAVSNVQVEPQPA